jgi:hypothetical protein
MYDEKVYNEYYPDHLLSVVELARTFSEKTRAQLKQTYEQPIEGLSKAIENSKALLSRRDYQELKNRLFNILNKNLDRYLSREFKLPPDKKFWERDRSDRVRRIFSKFHDWED